MKLLYFKSAKGNFGDDLNPWLWPKIFAGTKLPEDTYLIGIGSILHTGNNSIKEIATNKKIVFGTGIRPSKVYDRFTFDHTWDVRFLRGPLSAEATSNKYPYISDSAYAVRQLEDFSNYRDQEKKYEISLMPYFHSVKYFDWQGLCQEMGYHYISPHSEHGVEQTLKEIAQSKMLITEAMHGAILADALRVPWHRYILTTPNTEGAMVSEFKWNDWLRSVGITNIHQTFIPFLTKGRIIKLLQKLSRGILYFEILNKRGVKRDILLKLSSITESNLSSEEVMCDIDLRMKDEIEKVKASCI
jgi:hypothetical protein